MLTSLYLPPLVLPLNEGEISWRSSDVKDPLGLLPIISEMGGASS